MRQLETETLKEDKEKEQNSLSQSSNGCGCCNLWKEFVDVRGG